MGGSTNAVLHLVAIAKSVGVPLTIDDFQAVSDRVPLLADFKPSGTYVMEDLHNVGGTPGAMKVLLENGFLHGDCLTVTGRTIAENLAELPGLDEDSRWFGDGPADQGHGASADSEGKPGARRRGRQDHG